MKFSSLVFDFDGTIADTLGEGLKIYNDIAQEMGLRTVDEDEVLHLRHLKVNDLLKHLEIPGRLIPKLLYRGTRELKSRIASLPLIDGMAEALPLLREKSEHFGILTSNSVENVELFLESHGLSDVFTFISSTSKLTGKSKYLRSIQRKFLIETHGMIYIGDEIRDVKAAQKADIPVAAVGWGFNSAEALETSSPDFLFNHPDELHQLVG